jgi:glycosyltransferase involved in cell wall biosynthesis
MDPIAQTRLSAVIPCYCEAQSVPVMHERLTAVFQTLGVDYEIIFVDEGSPDRSPQVLAELAERDRRVTVVRHTRAFGSQSAFSSGMRLATGDAVILLDGDLQDPPELIPALVARWREGYEVVYGERVTREGPVLTNAARKIFYRLFQRLSYVTIPLDAGEFSLLDRSVVDAINALPETNRFVRGLRAFVGYRQVGVPYNRPERLFGRSSNNFLSNLGWARRAIVSFSYVPLDLIGWLALLITAASLTVAVAEVVLAIVLPGAAPKGFATIIVSILFMGGVQLLCLSVMGSYMAHIYEEVKGRPPYIVDRVLNPPLPRHSGPPAGPAQQPAQLVHRSAEPMHERRQADLDADSATGPDSARRQ